MAFYIRKSVNVGPIRFNLSKSGIGVSAGVPGFRVGTGPRGNYVHVGRGGLYYRRTLPSGSSDSRGAVPYDPATRSTTWTVSHGALKPIESACVSQMRDWSSAALLSEIEQKQRRLRWSPIALIVSLLVAISILALAVTPWLSVPLLTLFGGATVYSYWRDIAGKSVVVMYDLDRESTAAYETLFGASNSLARCGGIWQVHARGDVYDRKYQAGADSIVRRTRIKVGQHDPPYLRTNVSVARIPLGRLALYFLPDRILAYGSKGVGSLSYSELSIDFDDVQFIEEERVPRDAEIVGQTWRYVNKSGGPDRRFKDNRQIPICKYEEIRLNSSSGLNVVVQASRLGVGGQLRDAVECLATVVEQARAAADKPGAVTSASAADQNGGNGVEQPRWTAVKSAPSVEALQETLFDVLCCLMVCDGRASKAEKAKIHDIMEQARAPWSTDALEDRISTFIQEVQVIGYRSIVSKTLSRVPIFKQVGKQQVLLRCVDELVNSDGVLAPREQALCQRIRQLLA